MTCSFGERSWAESALIMTQQEHGNGG
jgi:hypothetical protein